MPSQHFRCPGCGWFGELLYRAADVDDPDCWPPMCGFCDTCLDRAPQPGDFALDLKTDGEGDQGFQKFTVHRQIPTKDGPVQVEETIDSLHKLRQLEKDSEQRYIDGEGEVLRFRGYNQESSNMDVGSFGTAGEIGGRHYDSGQAPQKTDKIAITRHGQRKPQVTVAKGGGVSPL